MTFPKCEPFQFSDSSGPRYLWGVRLEDSTGQEKIVEHQRIGGCGGKTGEEWARLFAAAPDLLAALQTWMKFFDTMPKGQFGKLSFDVGLMNDGFLMTRAAIAKAIGA